MDTYLITRRSGEWKSVDDIHEAAARSTRVGAEMPDEVSWIRSYVTRDAAGALGTVCIYEATGPEAIREHAGRALLPADEIVPVIDTVVVRADPAGVGAN